MSALHVGMHIVKADGTVGKVFAWTLVPGASVMYNLEVQQDHTFTVGDGQWVVHNSNCIPDGFESDTTSLKANKFQYPGLDRQHFIDHGASVGATDEASYVSKAQAFLSGAPGEGVAQLTNKSGSLYYRYNVNTGEFGAVNARGIIATYYNISRSANPWAYFMKQVNRP